MHWTLRVRKGRPMPLLDFISTCDKRATKLKFTKSK